MEPDPNFPDRPTHPDFDLLSASAHDVDAEIDVGMPFELCVGKFVDIESLTYLAINRAIRLMQSDDVRPDLPSALAGCFFDGFMIGVNYARKQRDGDGTKDDPGD